MRELRLEHHETQRDLAELLGLKSAVQRLSKKSKRRVVEYVDLLKLADEQAKAERQAVLRLRRACSILAPHPVVRFIDASCTRGQYVRWCQSQAFPHSESKPIHQLKGDTISPF